MMTQNARVNTALGMTPRISVIVGQLIIAPENAYKRVSFTGARVYLANLTMSAIRSGAGKERYV